MAMAQTACEARTASCRVRTVAARRTQRAEMPLFQAILRPPLPKTTGRVCIKDGTAIDPFCGSGTILIEAAYKALNIAPGLKRHFAAEDWDLIPSGIWETERKNALDAIRKNTDFFAYGYDIDPECVALTQENCRKAGIQKRVQVKQADVKNFTPDPNVITICNPPYGERLLELREAEKLYTLMGQRFPADREHPCFVISPHEEFEKLFGKTADKRRKLYNGMLKCQIYMYFK